MVGAARRRPSGRQIRLLDDMSVVLGLPPQMFDHLRDLFIYIRYATACMNDAK